MTTTVRLQVAGAPAISALVTLCACPGRSLRAPHLPDCHAIDVVPALRRDRQWWYRAECSCGRYKSEFRYFPGLAESAGRDHVKAMRNR